ncbi:DNA-directed RNA polymerase II subunit rpb1, partial [Ceratobasidium sp. 370]
RSILSAGSTTLASPPLAIFASDAPTPEGVYSNVYGSAMPASPPVHLPPTTVLRAHNHSRAHHPVVTRLSARDRKHGRATRQSPPPLADWLTHTSFAVLSSAPAMQVVLALSQPLRPSLTLSMGFQAAADQKGATGGAHLRPPPIRPSISADNGTVRSEDNLTYELGAFSKPRSTFAGPGDSHLSQGPEGRLCGDLTRKRVDFSVHTAFTGGPIWMLDDVGMLSIVMNLTYPE